MSVLVLSDSEVRVLLDMESCIEAMADVLAALQREELSMPLRFIFRPAGASSLMGFMPAYRGGEAPVFSLKEIVISPGNSAHGKDPHQGAVMLHDGNTGELRALLNASAANPAERSNRTSDDLTEPSSSTMKIICPCQCLP